MHKIFLPVRRLAVSAIFRQKDATPKMKWLSVAEKNDAAKTIAGHLSRGTSRRREGYSVYNKIYEFPTTVRNQQVDMMMTSVSGHLLTHAFVATYKNWQGCDPIVLFDAPMFKMCPENFQKIKKTLEREIRSCQGLIIWTDCDREGENIGFEIIEVCRKVKPNIPVYRAKFSEITAQSVKRALEDLQQPDKLQSEAVDVRSELDLRIGAAFTRFQTMRLQRVFPTQIERKLISYGSCQIPTLGFVVQRYKEAENFIPEDFWKLKVTHTLNELTVEFNWQRHRLFDKQCCEALLMVCQANPLAKVENVTLKPKSKWRPLPMDTIELEKLGSRKLKISAKETMTIAEKLYTKGFISYPRTETNIFSKEINLRNLVELQVPDSNWGQFASRVLEWGPNPREGKKSDQAHPPIHPTKFTNELFDNERRVYELIVRHFLACVSRDATGSETIAYIDIAGEKFTATGLCIHERNYLDVYIYDKWSGKEIHNYVIGNSFNPTSIEMNEGQTTAPALLTEADLIALMEKHGIGTDATHAEHINTIKEREYIGEIERGFLVPGTIGMGLVEGYNSMELELAQPKLRAGLEADLKLICSGRRNPQDVLREQIAIYKEAYKKIIEKARALDDSLAIRLNETPHDPPPPPGGGGVALPSIKEVFKCIKCNQLHMALKQKKDNAGYFLGCLGYPECSNVVWLPDLAKEVTVTDETCERCGAKKMLFKFKSISVLSLLNSNGTSYTGCIVCDGSLRDVLDVNESSVRKMNSENSVVPRGGNAISSTSANPRRDNQNRPSETTNGGWHSSSTSFNNASSNNTSRGWSQNEGTSRSNNIERSDNYGTSSSANNNSSRGWNLSSTNSNPSRGAGTSSGWGSNNTATRPATSSNTSTGGWGINTSSNSHHLNDNDSWRKRGPTPSTFNNNANTSASGENVKCTKCGKVAKLLTVRKEGPNKGRQFYGCEMECKFFQWATDENIASTNTASTASSASTSWGSGSNRSSNTMQPPRSNNNNHQNATGNKRKCGLCRQEGHTRKKCPRNS